PGKAGDEANFTLFVGQAVAELDYAQEVVDVLGGHGDVVVRAFFHHFARDFAANVSDLALQIADTGFAGIAANQRDDGIVREPDVLFVEAGSLHLLLDQELLGDLDLFRLGVAVQPQEFHAVLQHRRNLVQNVGCGDEKYL